MDSDDRDRESLGLYRTPDAARLLGTTPPLANGHNVQSGRIRYWIRTSTVPVKPISLFRFPFNKFRDLISMRLVAILRSRGITLREIRETEDWVRQHLHIDWPFISRPLWTYASEVYADFESHLVVASRSGQQTMDFLRQWLTDVNLDMSFDEHDLVSSWLPYEDITLDPKIKIGQSCVDGTRIPTSTISGKIRAGDSVEGSGSDV